TSMAGGRNNTRGTKFILLGFSDSPKLRIGLFSVFLGTYLLTVAWNLGFVILIRMDSFIHTPMYFFLSSLSLSFLDFCYVTSTTPKMLSDFFRKPEFISFMGCTMQYFFFASLGLTESCLLAAMAYDRCVAVCNPLLCTDIMSPTLCVQVVVGAYILNFCGPNGINHFSDLPQLLVLSCSETFFLKVIKFVIRVIFGVVSILIIVISYGYIPATILKISSVEGRAKAFNTCASHPAVVTFSFGSGLFVRMHPRTDHSLGYDKMASVFYTVVIPMLNPLTYSLRNKEIKDTLKWSMTSQINILIFMSI
uniref:G-protein coupled receptors family 1 profile domain-containing protein n=1 Tax=Phocoena sinus TaxID=42100 RepID=A0A8C9CNZ9_PHOSS